MPEAFITNPQGAYGLQATAPVQYVEMVNNSGGTLLPGDVVTVDVTGVLANTTTTANDKTVVGVVGAKAPSDSLNTQPANATYASGSPMPVIVRGPARINIAANTVAASDLLTTTTAAKVAGTNAGAPGANANTMSLIGIAMEASAAKDANNTIRCYINK